MEGCMAAAKEKCAGFAKDKCWRPFSDARIAGVRLQAVKKLVGLVSTPERSSRSVWVALMGADDCGFGFTNYRASELLARDPKYEWFFKRS
uniref:Uncharacterized protein LOC105126802 n=1 Tax=Rhizophora mucronata TaxID=61149 RepID=A0A2P2QSY2_RHIMU